MSDIPYETVPVNSDSEETKAANFDPVCVDAPRVYDSCGAKDCVRDLPVFFSPENQAIVETASSVRISSASVITSTVEVEPVAFHRGFYSVDATIYFAVCCEIYSSAGALPVNANGLAVYAKRVVLYGSESSVKTFTSSSVSAPDASALDCCYGSEGNLPVAAVHISSPMALAASISRSAPGVQLPYVPEQVLELYGGELGVPENNRVLTTVGIFTITQLSRNVQLTMPSYDFCAPRKECSSRTDDPCEAFSKIEFPTDSFFPPNTTEGEAGATAFPCNCK